MHRKYFLMMAILALVLNSTLCLAKSSSAHSSRAKHSIKEDTPTITNEAEYAEWVRKNESVSETSLKSSEKYSSASSSRAKENSK